MNTEGIAQPKIRLAENTGHPRCRWVCFYNRTDLEKLSISSLARRQWIFCNEWLPSECESKQLIKNITIIHVAPVHQFLSCEVKSCMFVRNKSINKMFLTSNCCFCLKCDSYIHIVHLNQLRNMHRSSTIYKRKQSKHFLHENVGGFWCERATVDGLFNGGSFIKDYGWFWPEAKLNTQLFASKDINWWTGVVWVACGLLRCFFSAVWTLILTAPIHCRGSTGEQLM